MNETSKKNKRTREQGNTSHSHSFFLQWPKLHSDLAPSVSFSCCWILLFNEEHLDKQQWWLCAWLLCINNIAFQTPSWPHLCLVWVFFPQIISELAISAWPLSRYASILLATRHLLCSGTHYCFSFSRHARTWHVGDKHVFLIEWDSSEDGWFAIVPFMTWRGSPTSGARCYFQPLSRMQMGNSFLILYVGIL